MFQYRVCRHAAPDLIDPFNTVFAGMLHPILKDKPRRLVVGTATQEFTLLLPSADWAESLGEHIRRLFSSSEYKVHRDTSEDDGSTTARVGCSVRFKYDVDPTTGWKKELGTTISNSYIAPLFFQNGAKSGFEMCFGPSTLGAWAKTRLESRIKKFTPHCVCRPVKLT